MGLQIVKSFQLRFLFCLFCLLVVDRLFPSDNTNVISFSPFAKYIISNYWFFKIIDF